MPPSVSSFSSLLALAPLLGAAFVAGSLTQLTRQLARPQVPALRPTAAQSTAAGIAALSVVALLSATISPAPAPALLLAAACVTGWSGPHILARLGGLIERQLGLVTAIPDAPVGDHAASAEHAPVHAPDPRPGSQPSLQTRGRRPRK
ncbi:hypothetical protein [Deinococcus hohokamensis]|uniref:Uncharacterized protein n=1 Tax=Deinococcus hohokamensis TaxID=309883 RepID=A0ABV9IDJ9_9DEIO